MQVDMHYYGTYCLARTAGLTQEASHIIANAAQFVDDNAQQTEIELDDASSCDVCATAHHTLDISNINKDDQRQVWVPFHFLPGNEGHEFTAKLVCRKDSLIAQQMCANHLSLSQKSYFLPLIGIMAHVYGDTFAHYGFSGVSSRKNRLVNDSFEFQESLSEEIKNYIVGKKEQFFNDYKPIMENIKVKKKRDKLSRIIDSVKKLLQQKFDILQSTAAEQFSGALGHGAAVTFPDRPFLEWRFTYENGNDSGWHNNPETFLEYSEKIHRLFKQIADNHPQWAETAQYQEWEKLAPKIDNILRLQGAKEQRINAWEDAAKKGDLLNLPEKIPTYKDWNQGFQNLKESDSQQVMEHPIYGFYQAASYHRWYVLRELLPEHGLMVA